MNSNRKNDKLSLFADEIVIQRLPQNSFKMHNQGTTASQK